MSHVSRTLSAGSLRIVCCNEDDGVVAYVAIIQFILQLHINWEVVFDLWPSNLSICSLNGDGSEAPLLRFLPVRTCGVCSSSCAFTSSWARRGTKSLSHFEPAPPASVTAHVVDERSSLSKALLYRSLFFYTKELQSGS